jgi:fumarylpyruvate hydrolase
MGREQERTRMTTIFPLPDNPSLPIVGGDDRFPVRRIFCVGRNYEAHAREMGMSVDPEAPFFFTKSAWALCQSGATIPFPLETGNCHYEMELVVAFGAPAFRVAADEALDCVYGYACGLDMTRRDLQFAARDEGKPWDFGKDFENAAVVGPITPKAGFGTVADQRITLSQNGAVRQDARLSEMIRGVPGLIEWLSRFYHIQPGDLLFTGTPAGVGPIAPGDRLEGAIEGLAPVVLAIGERQ